jgi:hypothetical protein
MGGVDRSKIGDHPDIAGKTESAARQQQTPDVRAIRARRMQKDQLQAGHTSPPSHQTKDFGRG